MDGAVIPIADATRQTAAGAIRSLKELGVRPVMLSGDSRATAQRIAAEVGIADYSVAALLVFEGAAILLGLSLIFSHRFPRTRAQRGVLLGAAAGLGFGVSDIAIKAVSGDVAGGLHRRGVAVIAVTSIAANMSASLAGVLVFGDPRDDALEVAARTAGFVLVLTGAALMPAPARATDTRTTAQRTPA